MLLCLSNSRQVDKVYVFQSQNFDFIGTRFLAKRVGKSCVAIQSLERRFPISFALSDQNDVPLSRDFSGGHKYDTIHLFAPAVLSMRIRL